MQNKWLMVAGEDAYPNQAGSGLAIFDFETLAWNQSDTSGDAFQQRRNCYVATCHDNAMVIMGGKPHLAICLLLPPQGTGAQF